MRPGPAPAVEVWNSIWSDYNENGLQAFYDWALSRWRGERRRPVLTTGSDIHGPTETAAEFGFNHVFTKARTQPDILAGIAAGHNYLSSGPTLRVEAVDDGTVVAMMGDAVAGARVQQIRVSWREAGAADVLRLMENGAVAAQHVIPESGMVTHRVPVDLPALLSIELRRKTRLVAVSNPIYFF